jgi:hypothetical protein
LRYSSPSGVTQYKFTLSGKNLNYTFANTKGQSGFAVFIPLWTLVEAQQSAKP